MFILNVLKCRPPENRDPNSQEIEKCEPYLKQQLKIKSFYLTLYKKKQNVLVGRTELDITAIIVEKLNKELPSLNIK